MNSIAKAEMISMKYRTTTFWILWIVLLLGFSGCKSTSENTEKCKYGAPVAIFSPDIPGIKQHEFSVKGQEGIEKVTFKKGHTLELHQSGCNEVRQEFRFTIPAPPPDSAPNWFVLASEQFNFMGTLSPGLAPFTFWGDAIADRAGALQLGVPSDFEGGFTVKIDKIESGDSILLIVELTQ